MLGERAELPHGLAKGGVHGATSWLASVGYGIAAAWFIEGWAMYR